jgi:hypothetical protein
MSPSSARFVCEPTTDASGKGCPLLNLEIAIKRQLQPADMARCASSLSKASNKGTSYSANDSIHTMLSSLIWVITSNFQELKDLFHS